jgi:hypothetical protein
VVNRLLNEIETFFESNGRKQFIDRQTTHYLYESNGFILRTSGNLTQANKDFKVHFYYKKAFPFTNWLIDYLEKNCNVIFTRWMTSIIEPGRKVLPHIDYTHYLFLTQRFMVELKPTTYEFFVEENKTPNNPGEIFEFNNNTVHRGYNPGPDTRVAIVFDFVKKI